MSTNKIISQLDTEQMGKELPEFGPGDTVVVQVKVKEGERERLQAFEGVCIAKRNRGLNSSFTVRKISHGEGVERVFQSYSPNVVDVQVRRNAYGRQFDSFVGPIQYAASLGGDEGEGVFIRAPRFGPPGAGVEVLAERAGEPVALRHGRIVLAAFHPELTADRRLHQLLIEL